MDFTTYRNCAISRLIVDLRNAKTEAVDAKLDYHFISEIDHMITTAKANMENKDEQV